MSLDTLAGLTGLSKGFLSMVENGHRQMDRRSHVEAVANALRVSTEVLAERRPDTLDLPGVPPCQLTTRRPRTEFRNGSSEAMPVEIWLSNYWRSVGYSRWHREAHKYPGPLEERIRPGCR